MSMYGRAVPAFPGTGAVTAPGRYQLFVLWGRVRALHSVTTAVGVAARSLDNKTRVREG